MSVVTLYVVDVLVAHVKSLRANWYWANTNV